MNSGDVAFFTIDSLSAFWPGLQVLAGDVQSAIRLHMICKNLRLGFVSLTIFPNRL
jgi:ER degradation enhancer, mannosidase alpha-like 1